MVLGTPNRNLLVGNLESVRVVLDVRDIVVAYYLLMMTDESNGKVFNVSGDVPNKMGVYTDMLINASGITNIAKIIPEKYYRPIDIHYQHGDCTALKTITSWSPKYNIETTMNDLLEYWIKKLG